MTSARSTVLMLVAVLVTLALGVGLTTATIRLENRAAALRIERLADSVMNRLHQRMMQHIALLRATRSFFDTHDRPVRASEFAQFIDGLNLHTDYPGVQGIGYAALVPAEDALRAGNHIAQVHGSAAPVRPPSDQPRLGPIAMLHPMDDRNRAAIGYDMFSDPTRREAMQAALDSGDARATGPVELVQEITHEKQAGFLIYLPTRAGLFDIHEQRDGGFVYAPFRAGDLHQAVLDTLPNLQVSLRTVDTQAPERPLFDNTPADVPGWLAYRAINRDLIIGGRTWQVTLTPAPGFYGLSDRGASLTVAALSLLLLLAVAGAIRNFQRALAEAERSGALAARDAEERALLLREMQHRIKNHLARVQAIARQTLRTVPDLGEFGRVFGARIGAMAKAQDAILRNPDETADLRDLLGNEIAEVVDRQAVEGVLTGPPVRLNAREAQALGLVVYELSTNAMKYGAGGPAAMRISWNVAPRNGTPWLSLVWKEPSTDAREPVNPPDDARGGFGSQLIHALIEGDLEGRFAREFNPQGMTVTIEFPLASG